MDRHLTNLRLVIGAQKAATTSLYHLFQNHPGISTATIKETKYFADDELYRIGTDRFLETFYPGVDHSSPLLDIDPEYLFYPKCATRIYETIGTDAKILIILRDPVTRAYSQYNMEVFRRKEELPFQTALQNEPERITSDFGLLYYSYVSRGLYYEQVKRFTDMFGPDSCKILIYEEDFLPDKQGSYRAICEHFEINYRPEYFDSDNNMNPRRGVKCKLVDDLIRGRIIEFKALKKYPVYNRISHAIRSTIFKANLTFQTPPLSAELKSELTKKYFLDDIERLEKLIERDLTIWK